MTEEEKLASEANRRGPFARFAKKEEDAINPSHYKDIVPGFQYIDIMRHHLTEEELVGHLKGHIFKYLFRVGKKKDNPPTQDLKKADWYLDYLIKYLEEKNK